MKCTITVSMDNAAFAEEPGSELARAVRAVLAKVEGVSAGGLERLSLSVRDANGNAVGSLVVSD